MGVEFRFNNDLLRGEQDRKIARDAYGDIFFALDNPELRALFEPRDDAANTAKKRSRARGAQAVVVVTLALLITASMPLFETASVQAREMLALIGAGFGVVGGYLGLSGVLFGETKREWLRNRFTTERLRQLHFQTLLALAPLVLKAAETGDTAPFLKARATMLARFEGEQIAHLDAKLASVGCPTSRSTRPPRSAVTPIFFSRRWRTCASTIRSTSPNTSSLPMKSCIRRCHFARSGSSMAQHSDVFCCCLVLTYWFWSAWRLALRRFFSLWPMSGRFPLHSSRLPCARLKRDCSHIARWNAIVNTDQRSDSFGIDFRVRRPSWRKCGR